METKNMAGEENQIINVVDPRLDPATDREAFIIPHGAQNWEWYSLNATSVTEQNITFQNVVTVGESRVYQDKFFIEQDAQIRCTCTDAATRRILQNSCGPISFPLHSITDSLSIAINGQRTVVPISDLMLQRQQFWPQDKLDEMQTNTPKTKYVMGQLLQTTYGSYYSLGAPVNAIPQPNSRLNMSKQNNCCATNQPTVDADIITFSQHISEPVLCSPFNQDLFSPYGKPIWNITTMDLQYSIAQDKRLKFFTIPIDAAAQVTNIQLSISNPTIHQQVASTDIPRPLIYRAPFYEYAVQRAHIARTSAQVRGASSTAKSPIQQLTRIPQSIQIAIEPRRELINNNNPFNQGASQLAATITNLRVTLGNQTSLLQKATATDLYNISVANGLADISNIAFTQGWSWQGDANAITRRYPQTGSFIRLIPGMDLVLPDRQLVPAQQSERLNFQVEINFNQPEYHFSDTLEPKATELFDIVILQQYAGIIQLVPGNAIFDMNPLKDVDQLEQLTQNPLSTLQIPVAMTPQTQGAGVWDNIKRAVGNAWRTIKDGKWISKALKAGTVIHPALGIAGKVAETVGLGGPGEKRGRETDDDYRLAKKRGGAMMTNKSFKV